MGLVGCICKWQATSQLKAMVLLNIADADVLAEDDPTILIRTIEVIEMDDRARRPLFQVCLQGKTKEKKKTLEKENKRKQKKGKNKRKGITLNGNRRGLLLFFFLFIFIVINYYYRLS